MADGRRRSRRWLRRLVYLSSFAAALLAVPAAHANVIPATPVAHAVAAAASGSVQYAWSQPGGYSVSENVGTAELEIDRSASQAGAAGHICYGVTNASAEAGTNFIKLAGSGEHQVNFAAGQTRASASFPVVDQGINGPSRYARAFLYACTGGVSVAQTNVNIELKQDDALQTRDPANPLGYAQTPTNGDPLQFVNWYVFGDKSPAGKAAARYARSKPSWSRALHTLAYTPGSASYRFWMWNQPAGTIAGTVEKYLADAEQAQPGTTVQLTTYSLIHGRCERPANIRNRYEQWISQFAKGIGNFRVVLYLEEDSLIETPCLSGAQRKVRFQELAYAVKALSQDPHVLIYLDAGAPDTLISASRMASMLRQSDVAQAQGFAVNSTHFYWTTSDIRWGQKLARMTGGKHFIVDTGVNGRGPLLNKHPRTQGIENLCNPSGRGAGPVTWNTGYAYLDGLLWYNNVGNSDGTCGHREPATGVFFPAYAVGVVQRRVRATSVTGPRLGLVRSHTNM
jgi:endoglucanase